MKKALSFILALTAIIAILGTLCLPAAALDTEPDGTPIEIPWDTPVMKGDVNKDGGINKKDSLTLKKYLADNSTTIDLAAADVNGDGAVNKKDSLLLKQYLAGWDVQLAA